MLTRLIDFFGFKTHRLAKRRDLLHFYRLKQIIKSCTKLF